MQSDNPAAPAPESQDRPARLAPRPCYGLAAPGRGERLFPWAFERRALRPDDIAVSIRFCGVCHSDLHAVRGSGPFPLVPGHEIVGEVTAVGIAVTRFKPGDAALVGTIVGSCGQCDPCKNQTQQYCRQGVTTTYGGKDRIDGSITRGGYANEIVVDAGFAYHLPAGLDAASVAPLLCAGVTTWSPLKHWRVGPGMTVGVVGLGGLGHMAVKFAHALGAKVVAFTTSENKRADALALGADEAVLSTDAAQMAAQAWRFDFILDTVSSRHDLNPYLGTLKLDATLCCLGIPASMDFSPYLLTIGRRSLASSGVGGTRETQEMLDFCGKHGITSDVEVIAAADINEGFERLEKGDVRFRLVIDMATLAAPGQAADGVAGEAT
jgi:alcohol dehydrogenase (NADP+)